jgi:hypothetical protein
MKLNQFLILFVLALAGVSTTLTGQQMGQRVIEDRALPYFGLKGGLNFSDLTTVDEMGDRNLRTGFHAGLFYEIPVSYSLAFRPEVLYSSKGSELTYHEDFFGLEIVEGESKFNLNYLEVPLYLVIYLTDHFNVFAGPYAGFLLNANVTTQTDILGIIEIDSDEDINRDHFNSTDIGLSGGLGLAFGNLTLGASYDMGLIQVAKEGNISETLLGDARNMVLKVSLGLRF